MSENRMWREWTAWIAVVAVLATTLAWLGVFCLVEFSHPWGAAPAAAALLRATCRVFSALAPRLWPLFLIAVGGVILLALAGRGAGQAKGKA